MENRHHPRGARPSLNSHHVVHRGPEVTHFSIVLWESDAIIEYLIETYDGDEGRISFPKNEMRREEWQMAQCSHFETTDQETLLNKAFQMVNVLKDEAGKATRGYFMPEMRRTFQVLEDWLAGGQDVGKMEWLV